MIKHRVTILWVGGLLVLAVARAAPEQPAKFDVLHIGVSATVMSNAKSDQEDTARDTLRDFIKQETGFKNEIVTLKDHKEVADQLARRQIQLGMLEGYEFAWAHAEQQKLKPLAIAVNVRPYRQAYVVVRKDDKAADLTALQGKALELPKVNQGYLRLFIERELQAKGKDMKSFFSKVTTPENAEDALDDVVDGTAQAAVVDQLSIEEYKRRKPGRFARLRELMHSPPFPPPTVVYEEGAVDEATLKRFRDGLLNANRKEQGQTLLNLYKLTAFEGVPKDFDQVLQATLKAFPPPGR
jgi:ABC-type phosphate/phosphonate transport system substrate-binding protein